MSGDEADKVKDLPMGYYWIKDAKAGWLLAIWDERYLNFFRRLENNLGLQGSLLSLIQTGKI